MSDIATTTPTKPSGWKALHGFIILTALVFAVFAAAGFGWYAGAALARVLGL